MFDNHAICILAWARINSSPWIQKINNVGIPWFEHKFVFIAFESFLELNQSIALINVGTCTCTQTIGK
jgi:hypothetical protein